MSEKIIKPRCPTCNHCQADWVIEGGFTCRCGTKFEIGPGYVKILKPVQEKHLDIAPVMSI